MITDDISDPTPITEFYGDEDEQADVLKAAEDLPALHWWYDEWFREVKAAPFGPRAGQVDVFAEWCALRGGGEYERIDSELGYTVWCTRVDLGGFKVFVDLYDYAAEPAAVEATSKAVAVAVDRRLAHS